MASVAMYVMNDEPVVPAKAMYAICSMSHVTSHITHHTSHSPHHTAHITHHTAHITHHTSHITPLKSPAAASVTWTGAGVSANTAYTLVPLECRPQRSTSTCSDEVKL